MLKFSVCHIVSYLKSSYHYYLLGFLALFFLIAAVNNLQAQDVLTSTDVYMITLDDQSINPATSEYITQAIQTTEDQNAQALIIQLDTPGGLLTSTRSIVKRILTATVPIVVYVGPSGARAGSAGVFITYASHIAAMAPSTNIGAAHPVNIDGRGTGEDREGGRWRELKDILKRLQQLEKTEQEKEPQEKFQNPSKEIESEETPSKPATDIKESDSSKDNSEDELAEETIQKDDAPSSPMEDKILNDTLAFIRGLAEQRQRNVEWAQKSVSQSESITSQEALDLDVIEILATDLDDLLKQLNGRQVMMAEKPVTLNTQSVKVIPIEMSLRQKIFNILANPNIAYFLLMLGFYGLFFELTNPGIGISGVTGALFLMLGLYSMQILPTNYAGLGLIGLGLILLVAEAYTPTFGLLTLGGVIALVLGSLLLFDASDPVMRVSNGVVLGVGITTGLLALLVISQMLKTVRQKPKGGLDGLVGAHGVVREAIPEKGFGKVFLEGELWNAQSDQALAEGCEVEVISVEGLRLRVQLRQQN